MLTAIHGLALSVPFGDTSPEGERQGQRGKLFRIAKRLPLRGSWIDAKRQN